MRPQKRPEPDLALLDALGPIRELHERVAFEPLVDLEILDGSRRRQRTTFGDGTRVTVDFIEGTYRIEMDGRESEPRQFHFTGN